MKDHIPGMTDLAGIADRISHERWRAEKLGGIAFNLTLYLHESMDVEEALRKASTSAAKDEHGR
jgi:hypothetical protein